MIIVTNRNQLVKASNKSIGRLCQYRRSLHSLLNSRPFVYSHELAAEASVSAVQVRRDLMAIGYSGSPNRGYDIAELLKSINDLLDAHKSQGVALVGVGNLGRAIIAYVERQRPYLYIAAAFDTDRDKIGRVIHGCRTYHLQDLPQVMREQYLPVGIVAVPASNAQNVAQKLIDAGVRGILNFAPIILRIPNHIYIENLDWTVALAKAVYFTRNDENTATT
ncbi:MAG: redox-sensing transcriptional repressor Rex [Deltaproteobacteria bacterium]|nr:redox-sensing transcriptional repressor Rex [Deltaproteobacteria bacterium]